MLNKDILDKKPQFIIDSLEGKLTKQQIEDFIVFLVAGEEGLAYETLCEQIYEDDIKIPRKVFEILREKCTDYGVEDEYWKDLESLVVD